MARVLVVCAAPDRRLIRRFDLTSDIPEAVKREQLAFTMTPSNQRETFGRQMGGSGGPAHNGG